MKAPQHRSSLVRTLMITAAIAIASIGIATVSEADTLKISDSKNEVSTPINPVNLTPEKIKDMILAEMAKDTINKKFNTKKGMAGRHIKAQLTNDKNLIASQESFEKAMAMITEKKFETYLIVNNVNTLGFTAAGSTSNSNLNTSNQLTSNSTGGGI